MSKLTPQILGMYLGCDVATPYRTESEEGKPMNRLNGKMHEVCMLTQKCEVMLTNGHLVDYRIDEIKPILRPISSMTNEELEHKNTLCFVNTLDGARTGFNKPVAVIHDSPKSFMWMLSKGFDLFELIDSGLAIDSTQP